MNEPQAIVLERKKRIKKYLGIGLLTAAAVFLFLPDMAIFDILPDFIGYILLLAGISQLRDLNDYFGDAYDRFYKIAWISAVRYLAFFVVLGLVTAKERPDTILLLAFVFGVFDFFIVIPAWKCLFDGFSYLSARCDGTSFEKFPPRPVKRVGRTRVLRVLLKAFRLFWRKLPTVTTDTEIGEVFRGLAEQCGNETFEKPRQNRIERLSRTTILFIGFKAVLTALPEFSALTKDVEISSVFRPYDYIGIYRFFAMLAVLLFGCIWLARVVEFVRAAKKDERMISFYREKYRTDVLTKPHIFTHRHLKSALLVACIAMVLRVDIRLDDVHVIPDALLAGILCAAVLILGRHVGRRWDFFLSAGVFAAVSMGVNIFEYYFFSHYSITSIETNEMAYSLHVGFQIMKAVEEGLFVLMMLLFFRMLRHVILSYTGFAVTPEETRDPSEKIKTIHRELERGLYPALVFTVLSAVSKLLMVMLLLLRREGFALEWLPVLDTVLAVLFSFFTIRSVRAIYGQVEYRFMLL